MTSIPPRPLRRRMLALGGVLAAVLSAFRARAAAPRFLDALGRPVALKGSAERIVLLFSYEEFTAVAGPAGWYRVVGYARTQWAVNRSAIFRRCAVPIPRLLDMTDVGNTEDGSFSLERVLSCARTWSSCRSGRSACWASRRSSLRRWACRCW